MKPLSTNSENSNKFGQHTLIAGVLLTILGIIGLIAPGLMSITTAVLVGWMLIFGGAFWSYQTWQSGHHSVLDWLKPILLTLTGGLVLFYPLSGVAAIGLLLAIYLLFDTIGSFVLAKDIHPDKGWGWMTFNGAVSLLLAMFFLVGWPATSLFLVGVYVAISLFFDGWVLIVIGWATRKAEK